MFPYYYADEKLSNAVRILAVGEGDVRSRLLSAFREFHTLRAEHLPPSLQADYEWIINELTKREPQSKWEQAIWAKDGSVRGNLRRMINRTGSRIARKICDLQSQIQRMYIEWHENSIRNQNQ